MVNIQSCWNDRWPNIRKKVESYLNDSLSAVFLLCKFILSILQKKDCTQAT